MRELVPEIFTWCSFSERHGYPFNGTFVRHPVGNLCVDPVVPGPDDLATFVREGLTAIVLTNRNHVRGANLVRERTSAPVLIHPADAPHARGQGAVIDGDLAAGARLGPFTIIGVPGKSPGEVALHWSERRLLVVGDALIGNPPGQAALLPERVVDDPTRLRTSIRQLAVLDLETLILGDGESIVRGAGDALRALIATFPE